MFRAGCSPFIPAKLALQNFPALLQLCHDVPQEVLDKGLNKYGTAEEKNKFEQWLVCYNKMASKPDGNGRTISTTP